MTNTNPDTGIRYGTIYANKLNQDLLQDLLYCYGTDESYKEAAEDHYKQALKEAQMEDDFDKETFDEGYECPDIDIDEPCYSGSYQGVEYATSFLGGAILLWVFESPHIGHFDLCSPCVPGAVSIESPNPNGYEGYTIPEDWRAE